jgi:hypothetical protein
VLHLWTAGDEDWRSREDLARRPISSGAESFLAGTASCRIEVSDVDALFAELQSAGVPHDVSRAGVTATDFGSRRAGAAPPARPRPTRTPTRRTPDPGARRHETRGTVAFSRARGRSWSNIGRHASYWPTWIRVMMNADMLAPSFETAATHTPWRASKTENSDTGIDIARAEIDVSRRRGPQRDRAPYAGRVTEEPVPTAE